ncbi:hypothetical protein BaRGS_00023842, partial [Batillaria attramentaria]
KGNTVFVKQKLKPEWLGIRTSAKRYQTNENTEKTWIHNMRYPCDAHTITLSRLNQCHWDVRCHPSRPPKGARVLTNPHSGACFSVKAPQSFHGRVSVPALRYEAS